MNPKPSEQSIVSQRIAWLLNHQVQLHVKSLEPDNPSSNVLNATYLDIVPLGRVYFFVLLVDGRKTLIESSNVLQITDLS